MWNEEMACARARFERLWPALMRMLSVVATQPGDRQYELCCAQRRWCMHVDVPEVAARARDLHKHRAAATKSNAVEIRRCATSDNGQCRCHLGIRATHINATDTHAILLLNLCASASREHACECECECKCECECVCDDSPGEVRDS